MSNLPDGCRTEDLPGNSKEDEIMERIALAINDAYGEILESIDQVYEDFVKEKTDQVKRDPEISDKTLAEYFEQRVLNTINERG